MQQENFKKPSVTADLIIEDNGEIYLIQRKFNPYKGLWALPGGFLNVDEENVRQTARREAKEETGLDVETEDLELFHETSNPHKDNPLKNERGHIVSLIYVTTKYTGVTKPGDDAADVKKFPLDNLPDMAFSHKKIIEKYKIWRQKNGK
ncbi:MAG: NUDIX hydrolase [Candidatus Nanoarchaeia archaeon]|nr:NUDIX hydrolase [Candidatus Nanoarchaeia archaeon]MDD5740469.1 NUDIX hydrolase [Candidatus Nanoarchaeia archaeon]